MPISARAALFAERMDAADPAAFETAAQLDGADRSGLAELIADRVSTPQPLQRAPPLAFIPDDAWSELIALAVRLAGIGKSRKNVADLLDEAACEMPRALAPELAELKKLAALPNSQIEARRVKSWERRTKASHAATLHLTFDHEAAGWRWPHPSQGRASAALPRLRFGGHCEGACGFCHQPLHPLLTFEANALPSLPKRVVLATCLSCLGWEQPMGEYTLSFRHDANGFPIRPKSSKCR